MIDSCELDFGTKVLKKVTIQLNLVKNIVTFYPQGIVFAFTTTILHSIISSFVPTAVPTVYVYSLLIA